MHLSFFTTHCWCSCSRWCHCLVANCESSCLPLLPDASNQAVPLSASSSCAHFARETIPELRQDLSEDFLSHEVCMVHWRLLPPYVFFSLSSSLLGDCTLELSLVACLVESWSWSLNGVAVVVAVMVITLVSQLGFRKSWISHRFSTRPFAGMVARPSINCSQVRYDMRVSHRHYHPVRALSLWSMIPILCVCVCVCAFSSDSSCHPSGWHGRRSLHVPREARYPRRSTKEVGSSALNSLTVSGCF
jgi:hypothetical protein